MNFTPEYNSPINLLLQLCRVHTALKQDCLTFYICSICLSIEGFNHQELPFWTYFYNIIWSFNNHHASFYKRVRSPSKQGPHLPWKSHGKQQVGWGTRLITIKHSQVPSIFEVFLPKKRERLCLVYHYDVSILMRLREGIFENRLLNAQQTWGFVLLLVIYRLRDQAFNIGAGWFCAIIFEHQDVLYSLWK